MALTAKILNPAASLNSFREISAIEFIPGTALVINLQIFDTSENLRRVPVPASPAPTLTLIFKNSDGTTLSKAAVLNTDDRSLAVVSLTASETTLLVGGSIDFDLDEDGTITKGVIVNGLQNIAGC